MSQFKLTCQTRDSSYEIEITQKKKRKKSQDWKEKKWKKKWCQLVLAFQIHDPRK